MSMTCLPLAVRLAISSTSAPMRDRASVPLGFDTTAVPTLITTRLQSSKRLRSGCTTADDAKVRRSFGCCTLATRLRNPWTGGAAQLLIITISFCVRSRRPQRAAYESSLRSTGLKMCFVLVLTLFIFKAPNYVLARTLTCVESRVFIEN